LGEYHVNKKEENEKNPRLKYPLEEVAVGGEKESSELTYDLCLNEKKRIKKKVPVGKRPYFLSRKKCSPRHNAARFLEFKERHEKKGLTWGRKPRA